MLLRGEVVFPNQKDNNISEKCFSCRIKMDAYALDATDKEARRVKITNFNEKRGEYCSWYIMPTSNEFHLDPTLKITTTS